MENFKELLEIIIQGKDVRPENISIKDLADIILSFEESFLSLIKKEYPELPDSEIIISLVKISGGSATLTLDSSKHEITDKFSKVWIDNLESEKFERWPPKAIENLRKIRDLTEKRNYEVEFKVPTGDGDFSAKIYPSIRIPGPETYFLTGETTLYGSIERVGGATPKVVIRPSDRETIHCDVSEDLAKEIGKHLYSWCGVKGIAKWDPENYSIAEFEIKEITGYKGKEISRAVRELSELFGKYYKDIKNVEEYVLRIRQGFE